MMTMKKYKSMQNFEKKKLSKVVRSILKYLYRHSDRKKDLKKIISNKYKPIVKTIKLYKSNPQIALMFQEPSVSKHKQTILANFGKVSFQIRVDKYHRLTTMYIGYKKHPRSSKKI
jgi:hypothetical protein